MSRHKREITYEGVNNRGNRYTVYDDDAYRYKNIDQETGKTTSQYFDTNNGHSFYRRNGPDGYQFHENKNQGFRDYKLNSKQSSQNGNSNTASTSGGFFSQSPQEADIESSDDDEIGHLGYRDFEYSMHVKNGYEVEHEQSASSSDDDTNDWPSYNGPGDSIETLQSLWEQQLCNLDSDPEGDLNAACNEIEQNLTDNENEGTADVEDETSYSEENQETEYDESHFEDHYEDDGDVSGDYDDGDNFDDDYGGDYDDYSAADDYYDDGDDDY